VQGAPPFFKTQTRREQSWGQSALILEPFADWQSAILKAVKTPGIDFRTWTSIRISTE
jgi:hypothetical protein